MTTDAEWRYELQVKDEHIDSLRDTIAALTAERDRWRDNADAAQKLSLEYLREIDRLREALAQAVAEVAALQCANESIRAELRKLVEMKIPITKGTSGGIIAALNPESEEAPDV